MARRRLTGGRAGVTAVFTLRTRRDKWRILAVGAASFMAIFPLCAWRHLDIIEKDIYERATEALADAALTGIEVDVSGRDVRLWGTANREHLVRASELVGGVRGVRVVTMGAGDGHPSDQS